MDKGKAANRIFRWMKLHPYNIEQKVAVIVEHFRKHVGHLLSGQAKAMVVTDSRKEEPFVLDFVNQPDDVLASFRPYYRTAELASVPDPNLIYDLQHKLDDEHIYTWQEVEVFADAFFDPKQTQDKLSYHTRPAVDRFRDRYKSTVAAIKTARKAEREADKAGDTVHLANVRKQLKQLGEDKDALDLFKKNLGSFVRFYEFMSQIVDYDDKELEKLSVYARHLRPLLRKERIDEEIDISSLQLTHYRLKKIAEHELMIKERDGDYRIKGADGLGSGTAHDPEKESLSRIIERLNDLFAGENLTDKDRLNYMNTIKDKVMENQSVVQQMHNNTPDQVMIGDYPAAVQDAVMDSLQTHNGLASQLLQNEAVSKEFARLLLEVILREKVAGDQIERLSAGDSSGSV